jgi:NTP pyrophosphatase (non-canonical NTP hydrolase)
MATISDLTQHIGLISKKLDHSMDPKITLLFLLEELGETARAFLKEEGYKADNNRIAETSAEELGDVLFLLLKLAYIKNIDLEDVLNHTISKLENSSSGKHI